MGTIRQLKNQTNEEKIRQESLEELVRIREKQLEERAAVKAAKASTKLESEKETVKPKITKDFQKISKAKITESVIKEEE